MSTEPCVICCDELEIPPAIRDFTLDLRRELPADLLKGYADAIRAGLGTCWNCRGTKAVTT